MDANLVPAPSDAQQMANPFLGLRRFEIEDSPLFFGRNEQSYELLRRLNTLHFVAVIGPSGCGKSSLVRAGVLAALRQGYLAQGGPWKIVTLQPGNGPIEQWTRSLTPCLRQGADASLLVTDPVQALETSTGKIVILVDQFEELFQFAERTGRTEEVESFLRALLSTGAPDAGIFLVLTMRSEYLVQCARYPELAEAINEGLYLVPRMTRAQMRQAIVAPIQQAGATITVALVERLLDDAGREEDGLPVLQHALMRMWPSRNAFAPLGLDLYPADGGLGALLDKHAEQVYEALGASDKDLAQELFRSITERTRDGRSVRRARPLDSIEEVTKIQSGRYETVISRFVAEGFLLYLPGQSPLIDISHEAVARQWKRLDGWISAAARERRALGGLRDAAAEWERGGRERSYLYRGQRLMALETDLGKRDHEAGALEREFLAASRSADRWAKLLSLKVLVPVAMIVAVVAIAIIWAWFQTNVAEIAQSEATTERAKAAKADTDARAAQSVIVENIIVRNNKLAAATKGMRKMSYTSTEPPNIFSPSPATGAQDRVYPQAWDAKQKVELNAIIAKLPQNLNYKIQPVELLSVGPDATELRYFQKEEKPTAEKIAADFERAGLPVNLTFVGAVESINEIRANHFE